MRTVKNLSENCDKFIRKLYTLKSEVASNKLGASHYSIFAISQLNNFLRAYLISINNSAKNSSGTLVSFNTSFITEADLIDELIKVGNPRKYGKSNRSMIGAWVEKDEPAYHTPRVFLSIVNSLQPSNLADITLALGDSWKIDTLREIRNYYAHRSKSTELNAIKVAKANYVINANKADKLLLEVDAASAQLLIDDINDYIVDFAKTIS